MPVTQAGVDNDIWLHQILVGSSTGTDPKIKPRYIENAIDRMPPTEGKAWEAEISGRLLSLCPNVEAFADSAADAMGGRPAFYLRGFGLTTPSIARRAGFEVIIEPTSIDVAHAVLTIPKLEFAPIANGGKQKISQELLRKVAAVLSFCDPKQVSQLEREAGKAPNPTNLPFKLSILDRPPSHP